MHRMSLRVMIGCLTLALLLTGMPLSAHAVPEQPGKQVITLFVEGLSFADLKQLQTYPHVEKWVKHAQAGAMTIRPAGPRRAENAYLLLGSGGQALYTDKAGDVMQAEERLDTGETARQRMAQVSASGREGSDRSAILFPGIYRLHADNVDKPFTARIGLLGGSLERHGLRTAVYGNADTNQTRNRTAALFAINEQGEITAGDISDRTNRLTANAPFGLTTNYAYLLEQLQAERQAGLVVFHLGDLARLYRMKADMAPERFDQQYDRVLRELDGFLGEVLQRKAANQLIILTSAQVNDQAQQEKSLLTPLLLWKGGEAGGGQLLTSTTTRQPGLISGLDLLPTILSWLDVPVPDGLAGHVITSSLQTGGAAWLYDRVSDIDRIYANRSSVMYTYVTLQILIMVAAALVWLWRRSEGEKWFERMRRGTRLALLAMLFFPLLFLAEPWLGWTASPPMVLGIMIMFALGGALAVETWTLPRLLALVAGLTAGVILLDGFTGGAAMSRSYLGYDPVIGARFYGLGNEYEGVLIGASILLAAALYSSERVPGWLKAGGGTGWFALVLYYMASPALGADAGGFLAAGVGFGVTVFRLYGWRVGKKGLLLLTGGVVLGIVTLITVNLWSAQPLTHVGKVAHDIVQGNWTEVAHIVERKLEMNWRLIRVSVWSKVFVVSLLVIGLLSLSSERFLRRLAARYPHLVKGFQGVIAGSLAGLALNDSGIVTAATSILFFVVPALYEALGQPLNREYAT